MDGTGELFTYLLKYLHDFEIEVIPLPQDTKQDYETLITYIKARIPTEDFALVAESFSGALAAKLTLENIPNLKKIVFVATFLSPPSPTLLGLAEHLPLKTLSKLPFAKYTLKQLFYGNDASPDLIDLFDEILNKLPENVLNDRITTMKNLTFSARSIEVPSIYIQASSDKVVPRDKFNEFKAHFNNIELVEVEGPHFILQNKPEECANAIIKHVSS